MDAFTSKKMWAYFYEKLRKILSNPQRETDFFRKVFICQYKKDYSKKLKFYVLQIKKFSELNHLSN